MTALPPIAALRVIGYWATAYDPKQPLDSISWRNAVRLFALLVYLLSTVANAQERLPIIDVHMHANEIQIFEIKFVVPTINREYQNNTITGEDA